MLVEGIFIEQCNEDLLLHYKWWRGLGTLKSSFLLGISKSFGLCHLKCCSASRLV